MRELARSAFLPLRRYAVVAGRARRQEFWTFTLLVMAIGTAIDLLDDRIGLSDDRAAWVLGSGGVLSAAFNLVTLVPSITVAVRRLHDIGWSGWWLAPGMATIIGSGIALDRLTDVQDFQGVELGVLGALAALLVSAIVLLVLFCREGTSGANRFGEDPTRVPYEQVFG